MSPVKKAMFQCDRWTDGSQNVGCVTLTTLHRGEINPGFVPRGNLKGSIQRQSVTILMIYKQTHALNSL